MRSSECGREEFARERDDYHHDPSSINLTLNLTQALTPTSTVASSSHSPGVIVYPIEASSPRPPPPLRICSRGARNSPIPLWASVRDARMTSRGGNKDPGLLLERLRCCRPLDAVRCKPSQQGARLPSQRKCNAREAGLGLQAFGRVHRSSPGGYRWFQNSSCSVGVCVF